MLRTLTPAAALALVVAALIAGPTTAQSFPPHRFFGGITIDGQPAPIGTMVAAFIGDVQCGTTTVSTAGQYRLDVLGVTIQANCGRSGQSTVSFRVNGRAAAPTPTYRDGGFEQLDLAFGAGGPAPSPTPTPTPTPTPGRRFNGAQLDLQAPCIPESGRGRCTADEEALWNADRDAWARQGVVDQPPLIPFEGRVFEATVIRRVNLGDPDTIRNIARILGNPFLQVTRVRVTGAEYVEITNLGGGAQTMDGWSVRSDTTGQRFVFPAFTMEPGQICRVYSGTPGESSCGGLTFNMASVWPDDSGRIILNYDALALLGDDVTYNTDAANQPPPPNLQGIDLP